MKKNNKQDSKVLLQVANVQNLTKGKKVLNCDRILSKSEKNSPAPPSKVQGPFKITLQQLDKDSNEDGTETQTTLGPTEDVNTNHQFNHMIDTDQQYQSNKNSQHQTNRKLNFN